MSEHNFQEEEHRNILNDLAMMDMARKRNKTTFSLGKKRPVLWALLLFFVFLLFLLIMGSLR